MAWGQPRATTDVDALTRLERPRLASFIEALAQEGLTTRLDDLRAAMDEGGHATVFDSQSAYHVDIKPARTAGEIEQVESATEVPFEAGRIRVATAEHTVAYKLLYGSERDLQDAQSILVRLGPRLDRGRLDALVLTLGVADRLRHLEADVRRAGG